jgi:hypothetical protein
MLHHKFISIEVQADMNTICTVVISPEGIIPANKFPRVAMWGPILYPAVDKKRGVDTIAEATYRYVHGEITDPKRYQSLMNNIMDKTTLSRTATHKMKMRAYAEVVNRRYFGKTAIESFVAMEIAVRIAQGECPKVGFRRLLHRTFLGLLALQETVGPWVDTSNEMIYRYGVSDTNANIASACIFFTSLYTKTMIRGEFIVTATVDREYTARHSDESLADSILFDYIKMLFPSTPAIPVCDTQWLAHKFSAMRIRSQAICYQSTLFGHEIAPIHVPNHEEFFHFVNTITYLGTNLGEKLSEADMALIAETDIFMLPFLQASMNHAMRISSYRL